MQTADDVKFGDADGERGAGFFDDLFGAELPAVGVAFFAGERAELAAQDAVVGVVDVGVDDVGGAVADFALAGDVGKGAEGVNVFGIEKAEGFVVGEPFACDGFVVEVAEGLRRPTGVRRRR